LAEATLRTLHHDDGIGLLTRSGVEPARARYLIFAV
jgi:hypothetical protein